MKNKLKPVLTFAVIDIRRLFRDKVGIFFIFFFPLMFLLVFGSLFGRESSVSFNLALFNRSSSQFSENFVRQIERNPVFEIKNGEIEDIDDAREQMSRGQIDGIIILPANFGQVRPDGLPGGKAEVIYDRGNEQAGTTLKSIMENIFDQINSELSPAKEPFSLTVAPTQTEGLTSLDFLFSGMLGFTLLTIGVFGPTTVFPRMKERGVLRRYHTTPIRVWQYFAGNVLSNAVIGLMAVAFMFVVALIVFDVSMKGDYLSLALLTIIGAIVMFGIGLAAGGWAKNENQAQPLANIIAFPMMFLSGVFFPRFLMPDWLETISSALPLTPLIDGLRLIITEGQTILDILPEVAWLAGWAVIIYVVAFRVFRWE